MYGFLDSYAKRKAFKKALDKAFDDGYDPVKAAVVDATPVSLGKVEGEVKIVDTSKYVKSAPKAAKSLRKPESGLIDLSKHKNWRENELKKEKKDEFTPNRKGASLFDELFPESKSVKPASTGVKTSTNEMLDKLYPGSIDKFADTSKEDLYLDIPDYVNDPVEVHPVDIPIENYENEEPSVPELDSDSAWEELFSKLNIDEMKKEIEQEEIVEKKTPKLKIEKEPIKPVEKEVSKPKSTAVKPKTQPAKKPTTQAAASAKTPVRNKKRKNKVKFDADIIGGW